MREDEPRYIKEDPYLVGTLFTHVSCPVRTQSTWPYQQPFSIPWRVDQMHLGLRCKSVIKLKGRGESMRSKGRGVQWGGESKGAGEGDEGGGRTRRTNG